MHWENQRAWRRQYSLPISSTSRQMFGLKRRLVSALWVLHVSSQPLAVWDPAITDKSDKSGRTFDYGTCKVVTVLLDCIFLWVRMKLIIFGAFSIDSSLRPQAELYITMLKGIQIGHSQRFYMWKKHSRFYSYHKCLLSRGFQDCYGLVVWDLSLDQLTDAPGWNSVDKSR